MKFLQDQALKRLQELVLEPDLSATKYRLMREIGRGGMATVYLVRDTELHRDVALKVLSIPDAPGELAVRMRREAEIVARLEHPGIVPIHDVGTLPCGRVYYVMKNVAGVTLDAFVGRGALLPEKLRVLRSICEAVGFAHARGVIHRDLKPRNIMVGAHGEVLVMDWGVAKILREEAHESAGADSDDPAEKPGSEFDTGHGTILGTPSYMAPEQARGELSLLSPRSDVYSLGAVLFFLLTRQDPPDNQPEAIATALRTSIPKIPRALEAVCVKAMSTDPDQRYESAEQMGSEISRFLDGLSVSAYRETLFEKSGRWILKNQFILILLFTYLFFRVLLLVISGH